MSTEYRITVTATGEDLGIWDGECPSDAVSLCLRSVSVEGLSPYVPVPAGSLSVRELEEGE